MPTIALMVAWHLQLSCFAMLASCHLFSVQPEISPCTALENWVLHNMSCTRGKRKEKNITIRLSKQKLLKINSRIKLSQKNQLWKINPIDKKLHHFEDGVDNQSVCSQVLVDKSPSLLMQLQLIQLMKIIASASCCICSFNNPPS
jgi:hypothetical protein